MDGIWCISTCWFRISSRIEIILNSWHRTRRSKMFLFGFCCIYCMSQMLQIYWHLHYSQSKLNAVFESLPKGSRKNFIIFALVKIVTFMKNTFRFWSASCLDSAVSDPLQVQTVPSLTLSRSRQCRLWPSPGPDSAVSDPLQVQTVPSLTLSRPKQYRLWPSPGPDSAVSDPLQVQTVPYLTLSRSRQCRLWPAPGPDSAVSDPLQVQTVPRALPEALLGSGSSVVSASR